MIHRVGTDRHGQDVFRIDLKNGGLSASVLSYGAILQDLKTDGLDRSLVLGFKDFAPYLQDQNYFGALVGRCANRIKDGKVSIDGHSYQLDLNENASTHLHGGHNGTATRTWQIMDHADDYVVLKDHLPDGHMGYPGALNVHLRIDLTQDQTLKQTITATTDAATLCNFAHHSYFNLGTAATIAGHQLSVGADHYLALDEDTVPNGQIKPVAGSPFDFKTARTLDDQTGYDTALCLAKARRPLHSVAQLTAPDGSVHMTMSTTEPGLQIYTGQGISTQDTQGHNGHDYKPFAGIALEAQGWPDAANHSAFPSTVLRPNETYRQVTQFKFQTA